MFEVYRGWCEQKRDRRELPVYVPLDSAAGNADQRQFCAIPSPRWRTLTPVRDKRDEILLRHNKLTSITACCVTSFQHTHCVQIHCQYKAFPQWDFEDHCGVCGADVLSDEVEINYRRTQIHLSRWTEVKLSRFLKGTELTKMLSHLDVVLNLCALCFYAFIIFS